MHTVDFSSNHDGRGTADSRPVRVNGQTLIVHAYLLQCFPFPTPLLAIESSDFGNTLQQLMMSDRGAHVPADLRTRLSLQTIW
jgi:hypothetical protein